MTYSPQLKEIEMKINFLLEKLEINSQFEKARLLNDLIIRLKTIFINKNIKLEILFNSLYVIIQLANSPLQTNIDIEMLRERFEERYIRNESNSIVRNMKYNLNLADIQFHKTVNFEPVDYNEPSSDYEYSEEEKEEFKTGVIFLNIQEENKIIPKSKILSKKIFSLNDDEPMDYLNFENKTRKLNEIKNKTENLKILEIYKKLFKIDNNYENKFSYFYDKSEESVIMLNHLFKINMRCEKSEIKSLSDNYFKLFLKNENVKYCVCLENLINNYYLHNNQIFDTTNIKYVVDSDYILNLILINLASNDNDNNENNKFINNFNNLICLDINSELLNNIIKNFNQTKQNLNSLQIFHTNYDKSYKSIIIEKLNNIINEFLNIHEKIIDSFIKLINYQKGKIPISNKNIIKISDEENQNYLFNREIIKLHNKYIDLNFDEKLTILKFYNFYNNEIFLIVEYFTNICNNFIKIKNDLKKLKKTSNTIYTKEILDFIYNLTKSKHNLTSKLEFILFTETFFNLIEIYLKIVYEFIINGNLIDINNEFFIDHISTKKENKKIIFNFNEKFKNFDWIDSFKIKSYSCRGIESACVPFFLMMNNIHFKILETSKSTFLIKNLKNYEKIKFELFLNENENNFDFKNMKNILNEYLKNEVKLFENFIDKNSVNNLLVENNVYPDDSKDLDFLNQQLKHNHMQNEIFMENIPFKLNNDEDLKINFNFVGNYNNFNNFNQNGDFNNLNENISVNANIKLIDNFNYKSYFIESKSGKIEINLELETMQNLINSQFNINKNIKKKKYFSFNLDLIIKKLIHTRITQINKIINMKLLTFLIEEEKLMSHFELVFNIFLFKSGFSMNKFTDEIEYCNQKRLHENDNFYLKNSLIELCNNSDLNKYKEFISDFMNIHLKVDQINLNIQDDIILIEYEPKLPIRIFFDKFVIGDYNSVFNFILKIKRMNNLIKNIEIDKKLRNLDKINNNTNLLGEYNFYFKKILKYFINLRMSFMNFLQNLEFYIFYSVIDEKIKKLIKKISTFKSLDSLISYHVKFIKEINYNIGLKDKIIKKNLIKISNMMINYDVLINKLILIQEENKLSLLDNIFSEIFNLSERFKKKENKFNQSLGKYKEKYK